MKKLLFLLLCAGFLQAGPVFGWGREGHETIAKIAESHIGAVCVESRPHPDFVGPRWWHDMDIIMDECRRRGMKVWVLDDASFPTGYAAGSAAAQRGSDAVLYN